MTSVVENILRKMANLKALFYIVYSDNIFKYFSNIIICKGINHL